MDTKWPTVKIGTTKRLIRLQAIDQLHRIRQKRNDFLRKSILEDDCVDLFAELAGYRFDDFHEILIEFQAKHKTTLQLAPRGWGKTTIGTCLWIAYRIIKNRNLRILIASETATQAWEMLYQIKTILLSEPVAEVFGDLKGDIWHESAINIAGRTISAKEKTISTCGADGAVTGGHFDEIHPDDLVSFKNSRTEAGRQKIIDWFRLTLLPTITDSDTEIHVKGTCYHSHDFYAHLQKNDPKFRETVQIIPAINPETGESNHLEYFSTQFLEEMKESMGTPFFNANYNQDPSSIAGEIFEAEYFRYYKQVPEGLRIFIGVDLAVGIKSQNDCFAIVTIGVDPKTLNIYLLDYRKQKLSLVKQNELILRKYEVWNPVRVGIESNAYQLSKFQELRSQKQFRQIPVIMIYTKEDKITRAQRLAVRYERGEIWHPESEKEGEIESDLIGFPDARYKDLVDGLEIATRTAFKRPKKKKKRSEDVGIIGGKSNGINTRRTGSHRKSDRNWFGNRNRARF